MITKHGSPLPFSAPYNNNQIELAKNLYVSNLDIFKENAQAYWLYLSIQNYWVGIYKCENEQFREIELNFFKFCWTLGEIFVTYINNEFQLWEIVKRYKQGLKMIAVDARLVSDNSDSDKDNEIYRFANNIHGIYVKWSLTGLSSWFYYWRIINNIAKLEQAFLLSCYSDAKKWYKIVNHTNQTVLNKERDIFLNPKEPFITIFQRDIASGGENQRDTDLGAGTGYKEIKGESKSSALFQNLQNYTQFVFNYSGMAVPMQNRESGKTDNENGADFYNTANLEDIPLRNFKIFTKNAKKLWKIDLFFSKNNQLPVGVQKSNEETK